MSEPSPFPIPPGEAAAWLTAADRGTLLARQPENLRFEAAAAGPPAPASAIDVDPAQTFQPVEGFGFSLTGGSALLLARLPAETRRALLEELFAPGGEGLGASMLRLAIGASDLGERSFSYDDRPEGEEDFALAHFDLAAGDAEVVPMLREILAVNPGLRLIACPWSAPPWMKTNHSFIGGRLRPECRSVYAAYFVKYLKAMREAGIDIHAITPQNEPLNPDNEPSMAMAAAEQAEFIKNHLGPALAAAGLRGVEIFCFDHNCDMQDYPLAVLADPGASQYLAGSAWHLYGGDIAALSEVHAAFPDKKLYFTEQWVGADGEFGGDLLWHMRHVLVGSLRNWSRAVLEWNLASDPACRPHTPGGSASCVGALTLAGENVERNVAYYVIGHAAKFLRPGAVRVASDGPASLPNVAFQTPDGQIALIVLNDGADPKEFAIRCRGREAKARLPGRCAATYLWPAA